MEEKEIIEIEADTFMKMFLAISYLNEQVFFNLVDLTGYLWNNIQDDDKVGICDQMTDTLSEMMNNEIVTKVEGCNCLYQVHGNIDYINIMRDNGQYKDTIVEFFKNYYDRKEPKVKIIANKEKTK